MKPGVRAYFSINGKAADGKESSYTGSFTTRGYPVVIAVRIGESPASDAKVKIGQKTYAVANTGTLSLTLAEGNYTGSISSGSETKSINFSVAPKEIPAAGPPEQQTFSFSLAGTGVQDSEKSNSSTSILMFVGVLIGGSLLLGAAVMVFMVYRRRHLEAGFNSNSMGSSVVIDDGYDWKSYQKRVQEEAAQLDSSAEQTTPFDTPSSTGYGYTPVAPPTNPSALKPGFDDEIPKDMFEIAKEKELQEKNPQS
ncbi:TPA: hypothetical protein DEW05_03050 [Candidatus Saccharibacteria bacterium]|nr:hypothetical protein [Candidatus Saccharibacteria bacterium]